MPDELPEWVPPTHDTALTVGDPSVDAQGVRTFRDVDYVVHPGYRPLRLDLRIPPGRGLTPVVVYIHGGGFGSGSRRENVVSQPIWRGLIAAGLAVASVEYRLSGEAVFPACLHDVRAAVRWLRAHGDQLGLSVERIGVWGESAGGYLATFLGVSADLPAELDGENGVTDARATVDAVVAWYPVTDVSHMDGEEPDGSWLSGDDPRAPAYRLLGAAPSAAPRLAALASPLTHVDASASPMFLVHGDDDRMASVEHSLALAEKLRDAGVEVDLELVPGAGHGLFEADREALAARSAAYLKARLTG